jgi:lysophospholipase L1-like esterase
MSRLILHRIPALLAGCLLTLSFAWAAPTNTAIQPAPKDAKWMARHESFLEISRRGGIELLFVGDSITDFWRDEKYWKSEFPYRAGKALWDRYYAPQHAANFGIGADRTQNVLWRIEHGELDRLSPKVVVLMIGTNNAGQQRNTRDETIQGIAAVVTNLRARLPHSRILLCALLPRGEANDPIRGKLREINAAIALLDDGRFIRFVDFGDRFLVADGSFLPEVMPDLLHPSEKGYQIWVDAIRQPLADLMQPVTEPAAKW